MRKTTQEGIKTKKNEELNSLLTEMKKRWMKEVNCKVK